MYYFALCYLILSIGSCSSPDENSGYRTPMIQSTADSTDNEDTPSLPSASLNFSLPYQLDRPKKSLELPSCLVEVSGLSLAKNESIIASVQDEKGNIYLVNKYDGKVEEKIDFASNGDYEGIEIVGKTAYVVNSSGTIYEVEDFEAEDFKVKKYNTFLKSFNDVEGLAYDPSRNALLLACKGRPAEGESLFDFRRKKAIYAFDLTKKELIKEPVYLITLESVQSFLKNHSSHNDIEKLNKQFGPDVQQLEFNPSAIAFHPKDKDLYILSAAGNVMMVLDRNGTIKHMEKLNKKVHRQPEGITFSSDGLLYISNEGSGKKAKIHIFYP
jgi:uncharacterized protein YjiK